MTSLVFELGELGIRVDAVCPGGMKTPMATYAECYEVWAGPGASEAHHGRVTRAEHLLPADVLPVAVRDAVVFLASDSTRHLTGVALPVDLGEMLV